MAARPKNNLNEHVRRIGGTPTPPARVMPASPLATGSKPKFKVSKSLTSSTPSHVAVRPPPSFSTPGFDKPKPAPQAANSSSVADASNLSIISISSTDSTALNTSTSSIPAKRVSSGSPADLFPDSPPKRPKTDNALNKENRFPVNSISYANGRARNRAGSDQPASTGGSSSSSTTRPVASTPPSHNVQGTLPATALHAALTALPHDAGLEEMSEEELRGVCSTSDSLLEWCNKQIGAARADVGDPRDAAFCNILAGLPVHDPC
ncbi:hypothetical protein FKP32DRAFT_1438968 [Trametes sanguinea]|nr:hypothetical protein FKP32DRAFT_1438968 [Trametes sanguinea]